jgi:hypothetical protein
MGLRDFKLFAIHWIFVLEINFMLIVPGQPQVVFVQADSILVLEQNVDVPFSEFVRNLQVAMSCDFVSGQFVLGSDWYVAFDGRTDFGGGVVHEWVKLIVFNFHNAHDVIPLNGDLVRHTVLGDDFAILVVVNAD